MHGERVLVTGATSGIGRAAAAALVEKGASVGIVGRDPERTRRTAGELGDVDVFLADLSELDQVRRLAADVAERWGRVDVLVNNAGINTTSAPRTSDGLDAMVATNLVAPFLLTNLLIDALRAGSPSRVVNVASEAHRLSDRIDPDTLRSWKAPGPGPIAGNRLYGRTKLALMLVTRELADRLQEDGIDVNACCPGLVATNLAGRESPLAHASKLLMRTPIVRRPEQGAAIVVRLASDPSLTGTTGTFFSSTPGAALLPEVGVLRDGALRERLWDGLADVAGLSPATS